MNTMPESYSDMPISNTAATRYGLMRGVVPIGVTAPRGATSVMLSPAWTESWSASRRPIATPLPSSKPSSVPCLMFLATEVMLSRSLARMPRTSTPEALNGDDANACPSTTGAASRIPDTWLMRSATSFQSVSGLSSGCTSRWPLRPRILSSSSLRKPFITAITMMRVATPSMMPRKENPAITEMNPSLRRARK